MKILNSITLALLLSSGLIASDNVTTFIPDLKCSDISLPEDNSSDIPTIKMSGCTTQTPTPTPTPRPTPISGVCGSSNGLSFTEIPATNLCSRGSAGSITLTDGVYNWSCSGRNGGRSASCSAEEEIVVVLPHDNTTMPTDNNITEPDNGTAGEDGDGEDPTTPDNNTTEPDNGTGGEDGEEPTNPIDPVDPTEPDDKNTTTPTDPVDPTESEDNNTTAKESVKKVVDVLKIDVVIKEGESLDLPTTDDLGEGTTITWRSTNEDVLTSNGEVNEGINKETKVALKAVVEKDGERQTKTFIVTVLPADVSTKEVLKKDLEVIGFDDIMGENPNRSQVVKDLSLPVTTDGGRIISWSATPSGVVNTSTGTELGDVTRGSEDTPVVLTATIQEDGETFSKSFRITVLKEISAQERVASDYKLLTEKLILGSNKGVTEVTKSLSLPSTGANGCLITWESDSESITNGGVVTRGSEDRAVTLTATITDNETGLEEKKVFVVTVLGEDSVSIGDRDKETTFKDSTTEEEGEFNVVTTTFDSNGTEIRSQILVSKEHSEDVVSEDGAIVSSIDISETQESKVKEAKVYQNANGTLESVIELEDDNGERKVAKISSIPTDNSLKVENDGSMELITTVGGVESKAVVTKDGKLQHKIVGTSNKETIATSEVSDSAIVILEDGDIKTTANVYENNTSVVIEVTGKTNGFSEHKVESTGKTTTASINIEGANTTISKDGNVTSQIVLTQTLNSGEVVDVETSVETHSNGETLTWFSINGTKERTISETTPLEGGADINVSTNSDGKLMFEIRTDVTTDLIIE